MLEPGKFYHIFNRGNNRENLFKEGRNYSYFLNLYFEHIDSVVDTFTYCLMKNHFHLLVRIKDTQKSDRSASQIFSNFFNAYSKSINKTYARTGALFQRPFGRIKVNSDSYLTQLVYYIHFKPQKHGYTSNFRDYQYSSYRIFLSSEQTKLRKDEVLLWFGGRERFIEFHNRDFFESDIKHFISNDEFK